MVPWNILVDESPEESPGLNDSFWLCAAYVKLKDMFHRKQRGWSGNLGVIVGLIVRLGLENLLLPIIAAIPAIVLLFMSKLGLLLLYILAVFATAGIYVYIKNKDEFFTVSSHDKQVSIDKIKETYELTVSELRYCEGRGGLPEGSWDDYGRIMGALYSRKYTSLEDAMLSLGYHLHAEEQ